jgi:PilZ domain
MGSNEIQAGTATSCGAECGPRSDVDQTAEVRREIRYPLRVRAEFVWVGRDGVQHEGSGHIRDISEHGAYILAKACPPTQAMIRMVIRFPYRGSPERSSRIEMDGRVVRVELLLANKSGWGFAVASTNSVLYEVDEEE